MVTQADGNGSKYLIFGVTGLAVLVGAFSINSMNLALPTIAAEFQVSQSAVSWLVLVYSLIPCCTLLFFGRLGDIHGYRRQFLFGFLFFGAVSLLTPFLAVDLRSLIFLRSLQGLGASMLISITQAIISRSFEASERGKALGINAVLVSIGMASGPTIGGLLIEHFSWRAIFFFNVPFCIIGFLVTLAVLKDDSARGVISQKKDWLGSILFAMSIGLFTIGFNFSHTWGWLSAAFLICAFGSVASMILFIGYEKRVEYPLMQLGLFQNATFSLANVICVCSFMALQMISFLTPFFLIDILLLQSDHSGMIMLIFPIAMMVSSPFGGAMTDKYGIRPPAMLGMFMIGVGCVAMGLLTETSGIAYVIGVLLLLGVGNGYSIPAINTAILSSVPREQAGVASGMGATMRNLGQTLGVTSGSVIIAVRQEVYLAGSLLTFNEAYLKAARDALFVGAVIAFFALALAYTVPDRKKHKLY